ncbi:MAG: hypothetical protein ACJ8F3_01095 [Xanthobacteraceae bacterium]
MNMKVCAAAGCAALIALTAGFTAPAAAQTTKRQYVGTTRAAPGTRPRARIVVAPRSFLDAGTEVRRGDRKFTDYAFPPNYTPLAVVPNIGGKVGWDRSPMMQPWELGGFDYRW